jgi:CheY-like chemotaxis protein
MPQPRHVVAVLNCSQDTIALLWRCLERAGFIVVGGQTPLFRDGKLNFHRFVADHRPQVIVYDITVPYEQSWAMYEHFRSRPVCRGIEFVLTTTNIARVREVAGPEPVVYEIVGKPEDLERVVVAVKAATTT